MSIQKPNLDLGSATRIARGQLDNVTASINERLAILHTKYFAKRGAWIRETEKLYREAYKETLILAVGEKRRVVAAYFMPLAEQYDGWLSIEVTVAAFGRGIRKFLIAAITNHTIARLMEGLRVVNPIESLKEELTEWMLMGISSCIADPNREEVLCVPTKSGYFTAKWDIGHNTYVFTSWFPARLLNDRDRAILDNLQGDERLGLRPNLEDCG